MLLSYELIKWSIVIRWDYFNHTQKTMRPSTYTHLECTNGRTHTYSDIRALIDHIQNGLSPICARQQSGLPLNVDTLEEVCLHAVRKFNPSALASRSKDKWHISEAALGHEMYAHLFQMLRGLTLWPEYAKDDHGRMDFYIPDKGWGIELLQNESLSRIIEDYARSGKHQRVGLSEKYERWGILKAHMTINFYASGERVDVSDSGRPVVGRLAPSFH